jgi:hypothetical protein
VTYLTGKIALDITAGAPNNGRGDNNVGEVKKLRIGHDVHPYLRAGVPSLGQGLPSRERGTFTGRPRRPGQEAAGVYEGTSRPLPG